jgi:hypothetical protein
MPRTDSERLNGATRVPDGFDECRVPLPPALRRALAEPGPGRDDAAARYELGGLLDRYVHRKPGLVVLQGVAGNPAAGRTAVLRISGLLGQVLAQDKAGNLVKEVRDRGSAIGGPGGGRYSDSRLGGHLHTDGAEAPVPAPDYFTLMCLTQAPVGGALVSAHLSDVVDALAGKPELLEVLRAPFHFDRRGDQGLGEPPTVPKPVLFAQGGRAAVTYLRGYIEQGHRHPGVAPLTTEQIAALDALDGVIGDESIQRQGKLREGELAVFDNLSLLHGRTEFVDTADRRRLLLRTWVHAVVEP